MPPALQLLSYFIYDVKFLSLRQGDYAGKAGLKKYFVTFQKAKLSCSDGGDYPVTFNEIRK